MTEAKQAENDGGDPDLKRIREEIQALTLSTASQYPLSSYVVTVIHDKLLKKQFGAMANVSYDAKTDETRIVYSEIGQLSTDASVGDRILFLSKKNVPFDLICDDSVFTSFGPEQLVPDACGHAIFKTPNGPINVYHPEPEKNPKKYTTPTSPGIYVQETKYSPSIY